MELRKINLSNSRKKYKNWKKSFKSKDFTSKKSEEQPDDDDSTNSQEDAKENDGFEEDKRLETEPIENFRKLLKEATKIKPDGFNWWYVPTLQNLTQGDLQRRRTISTKSKDNKLIIDTRNINQKKILKLLANFIKLPNLELISLEMPSDKNEDVNLFLKHSFPEQVQKFEFKFDSKWGDYKNFDQDQDNINQYMPELLNGWQKSTELILIKNFKIKSSDLNEIIQNSSKCKKVMITNCWIVEDKLFNFISTEPYKTEILNFEKTKWNKDKYKKNRTLLDAVSICGLRKSLQNIIFTVDCTGQTWKKYWKPDFWMRQWSKHNKIENIKIDIYIDLNSQR